MWGWKSISSIWTKLSSKLAPTQVDLQVEQSQPNSKLQNEETSIQERKAAEQEAVITKSQEGLNQEPINVLISVGQKPLIEAKNRKKSITYNRRPIIQKYILEYARYLPMEVVAIILNYACDTLLISGGADKKIRIWDVDQTGYEMTGELEGHRDVVVAIAVLTDGRLVSSSRDNTIRVWNCNTRKCIQAIKYECRALCALGDGGFVSGSNTGEIGFWREDAKKSVPTSFQSIFFEGHKSSINAFVLLPDGKRFVSGGGSADSALRVWDARAGECLASIYAHFSYVLCLAIIGDSIMASAGGDKTIRLWEIRNDSSSFPCLATLNGHVSAIQSLTATDDRRLISGSWDRTIRIWDTRKRYSNFWGIENNTPIHLRNCSINCLATMSYNRIVSGHDDHAISVGECVDEYKDMFDIEHAHNRSIQCFTLFKE